LASKCARKKWNLKKQKKLQEHILTEACLRLIIFGLGNDQLSRLAARPLARPTGAA
jgi:hypothetical protein